jgi:hypothetical protein
MVRVATAAALAPKVWWFEVTVKETWAALLGRTQRREVKFTLHQSPSATRRRSTASWSSSRVATMLKAEKVVLAARLRKTVAASRLRRLRQWRQGDSTVLGLRPQRQ